MDASGARARRRGRPRKGSQRDTRSAIIEAAAVEFADRGYDAATVRGIAARAGVDSALVYHYFETKAGLFSAAVRMPVRPDRIVGEALRAPTAQLGRALVGSVIAVWDKPRVTPIAVAVIRSALGGTARGKPVREFLMHELVTKLAERLRDDPGLDADEARLRAELALAQVAGVLVMRYVIAAEPLASLSAGEVAARVGPAVQRHIDGIRDAVADEKP